jgi:hypothetical protein
MPTRRDVLKVFGAASLIPASKLTIENTVQKTKLPSVNIGPKLWQIYDSAKVGLFNGTIPFDKTAFRMALLSDSYKLNLDHQYWYDPEVYLYECRDSDYKRQTVNIWIEPSEYKDYDFDVYFKEVFFGTKVSITASYAIIFAEYGHGPLLACVDMGGSISSCEGNFIVYLQNCPMISATYS